MKFRLAIVTSLALIALITTSGWAAAANVEPQPAPRGIPGDVIEGEFIVQLKPGNSPRDVAAAHGLDNAKLFSGAARGFAGSIPPGLLRALQNDPRVEAIVQDRVIGSKPGPPGKGSGTSGSSGQTVPLGVQSINASPADGLGFTGAGIGVAVLDSGVDLDNQDLNVASQCFDAFGGNCNDEGGHGTHVSGTIAALNNTRGVVGVAPGATIYPVRVIGPAGTGKDSEVIAGLDWVSSNWDSVNPKIKVVTMSLGRPGNVDDNSILRDIIREIRDLGITIVVAGGNEPHLLISEQVPATYPEVIAVASSTAVAGTNQCSALEAPIPGGTVSYFTTRGNYQNGIGVSISAPGERAENVDSTCFVNSQGILSLWPGDAAAFMSGSSSAAPHVAGVLALMYEKAGGSLDPEVARAAIRSSADGRGVTSLASPTTSCGYDGQFEGTLNAKTALAVVR